MQKGNPQENMNPQEEKKEKIPVQTKEKFEIPLTFSEQEWENISSLARDSFERYRKDIQKEFENKGWNLKGKEGNTIESIVDERQWEVQKKLFSEWFDENIDLIVKEGKLAVEEETKKLDERSKAMYVLDWITKKDAFSKKIIDDLLSKKEWNREWNRINYLQEIKRSLRGESDKISLIEALDAVVYEARNKVDGILKDVEEREIEVEVGGKKTKKKIKDYITKDLKLKHYKDPNVSFEDRIKYYNALKNYLTESEKAQLDKILEAERVVLSVLNKDFEKEIEKVKDVKIRERLFREKGKGKWDVWKDKNKFASRERAEMAVRETLIREKISRIYDTFSEKERNKYENIFTNIKNSNEFQTRYVEIIEYLKEEHKWPQKKAEVCSAILYDIESYRIDNIGGFNIDKDTRILLLDKGYNPLSIKERWYGLRHPIGIKTIDGVKKKFSKKEFAELIGKPQGYFEYKIQTKKTQRENLWDEEYNKLKEDEALIKESELETAFDFNSKLGDFEEFVSKTAENYKDKRISEFIMKYSKRVNISENELKKLKDRFIKKGIDVEKLMLESSKEITGFPVDNKKQFCENVHNFLKDKGLKLEKTEIIENIYDKFRKRDLLKDSGAGLFILKILQEGYRTNSFKFS